MPELPEVEAKAHDPALTEAVAALSLPTKVKTLCRRGKYILFELDNQTLVVHLRMSGRLVLGTKEGRVCFRFPTEVVSLVDQRRLSTVEVVDRFGKELGPEPFGDLCWLFGVLKRSRMPIKVWLLDQRKIAGIGNIYAAEILFRAGIDPRRPGNTLSQEEIDRLRKTIPAVLAEAIAAMGTTLRDMAYLGPKGEIGNFALGLSVYGKAGEPCLICGSPIQNVKLGGRSTYFCPTCQR